MTNPTLRVLLIDDDEDDYVMFKESLSEVSGQKYEVFWASTYEKGKFEFSQDNYDVCFLDYRLGKNTGLDFIRESIEAGRKAPMILLTGYGEHEVDVEAMRIGAADYLVKDQVSPVLLERSIRYAIYRAQSVQTILEREAQILVQDRLASIGLLASSLAHEIGTPLGVIRGRAEFLETQVKGDLQVKKNADIIVSQIDRISKLIQSLLNLARGEQTRNTEQVDLGLVVSEVSDLMGHEFRKHSIEFKNEIATDTPVWVKAEAGPLHQVLLNLFINSIHAIETAKKSGRDSNHFIRFSSQPKNTQCILTVEDSGCGISEKNLKNLFKPFFTTKEIGVGTGLGLVTSYRIIESWGGSIQVKSAEGRGTEFQIYLPKF